MAKAGNKGSNNSDGSKRKQVDPPEVKIIVEVRFPQLENQVAASSLSSEKNTEVAGGMVSAILAQTTAALKITPVKKIQIVEIDVNAQTIVRDRDVEANELLEGSGAVSPRRPISFRIHITGEANTRIDLELNFDGKEVFNKAVFIPSSGRLVDTKILL